jgi:hypothetical protein
LLDIDTIGQDQHEKEEETVVVHTIGQDQHEKEEIKVTPSVKEKGSEKKQIFINVYVLFRKRDVPFVWMIVLYQNNLISVVINFVQITHQEQVNAEEFDHFCIHQRTKEKYF